AVRLVLHERETVRAGRIRRERDADLLPAGVHLGDRVVIDELALPRRHCHPYKKPPACFNKPAARKIGVS
ncbi:MAG: hypothetical protein U0N12_15700, partial [Bacteroides uniformis]